MSRWMTCSWCVVSFEGCDRFPSLLGLFSNVLRSALLIDEVDSWRQQELCYGCLSPLYGLVREAPGKASLTIITLCLGCIRIIVLFRSLQDIYNEDSTCSSGV